MGVLVGISPFLTALLARIVLGESLHPGFFVGFVCAMSGIGCIAVNSNAVLRLNPLGDVLALLAALTWAFYSILTRKIGDYGYNTLQVTRRIFCWGLLFMLPTLPLSGFRKPIIRRRMVLFPIPVSPISAVMVPGLKSQEKSERTFSSESG